MTPDQLAVLRATPSLSQLGERVGIIAERAGMLPPFVGKRLDVLKAMGLVYLTGEYWSRTEIGDREARRAR